MEGTTCMTEPFKNETSVQKENPVNHTNEPAKKGTKKELQFGAQNDTQNETHQNQNETHHDAEPILKIEGLSIVYDHIPAVKQLDLTVKKGEIVALIGANGAGKTSTLRCISGIVKAKSGRIVYEGQEITNMEPHRIVKLGISHVPEGRGMFADLTVLDNLRIGAYLRKDRAEIRKDQEKMFRLFPRLEERKSQLAGTLSGGEQQMLAIARALMARPKLLLLDEPSMGLAPMLVQEIFKAIREINESGVSVLVVEQNTRMALALANRGYVLESGEVILQGNSSELKERLDPFTLQIR